MSYLVTSSCSHEKDGEKYKIQRNGPNRKHESIFERKIHTDIDVENLLYQIVQNDRIVEEQTNEEIHQIHATILRDQRSSLAAKQMAMA